MTTMMPGTALNRARRPVHKLVENRTLFESHGAELSIYDTYARAARVRLDAEEFLYCGMISGRKLLHGGNLQDQPFLPRESFVMAPGQTVEIDFPDATLAEPTTCLAIGITREKLLQVCDSLNQAAPATDAIEDWRALSPACFHGLHSDATQQLLNRIVAVFLERDLDRDLVLDLGVTELLTRLVRHQGQAFIRRQAERDPTRDGLSAVVHFIDAHLAEEINVDQMCQLACMSRSKLYDRFRLALGCSPMEFLLQRRLEKARDLIAAGCSVTRACFEVGYINPSHFARRFHQRYGVSPRQYSLSQRSTG